MAKSAANPVTSPAPDSEGSAEPIRTIGDEPQLPPQRNSRWLDLVVLGIIVVILLGGVGKAFADSDLFAEPQNRTAAEACPEGGCVKPPDEVCAGLPVKAVVGRDGGRLYYAADHPGYQGIIAIHVERGDRWFCTAGGAETGGFAPAP